MAPLVVSVVWGVMVVGRVVIRNPMDTREAPSPFESSPLSST